MPRSNRVKIASCPNIDNSEWVNFSGRIDCAFLPESGKHSFYKPTRFDGSPRPDPGDKQEAGMWCAAPHSPRRGEFPRQATASMSVGFRLSSAN